jgi:UDP-glucuronate 4-epimerase
MHVLITGGAGFIGSHLAEALLARGDHVTIVDNFDPFYPEAVKRENLKLAMAHGAALVLGDIVDREGVTAIFRAQRPDVVVHLAARAGVRPSLANPSAYVRANIDGTLAILDACRQAGIGRMVFGSSSSVYGINARVPFQEDDPILSPASPYGATKAAGELLCHTYAHIYGLNITCLRFFTVYGPRQRPDMAIHKFARLLCEGKPLPIFGSETARDYTYVSDIIQGIVAAIDRPRPYRIYNLGESQTVELDRMVALLAEALRVPLRIVREPFQPGDVPITYADVSRARAELDYRPAVPFAEGIQLFADWYRETRAA